MQHDEVRIGTHNDELGIFLGHEVLFCPIQYNVHTGSIRTRIRDIRVPPLRQSSWVEVKEPYQLNNHARATAFRRTLKDEWGENEEWHQVLDYMIMTIGDNHSEFAETSKDQKTFAISGQGTPRLQYDQLVKEILEENTFITLQDTEHLWIYNSEKGIYEDSGKQELEKIVKEKLGKHFKKTYTDEIHYQMKVASYVKRKTVEPPPEHLNLENGILNTYTREFEPHNSKWFFTEVSPTRYDPKAEAPMFRKLLEKSKCPNITTLQEFCGNLLIYTAKYKKAGFIYGPTDSSKSTFTNAIIGVLGASTVSSLPIQELDIRFQLQRLYRKRLNACGDLSAESFSRVSVFKRTTGGDILEGELKGANRPLSFVWGGKHLFDANDLPLPKGDADSDAFYNRLLLFPFPVRLRMDQIDRSYGEKLATPEERSGVLNWMLDGLDRLECQQGFTEVTDVSVIREQYKRAADSVYCFVSDCCKVEEGKVVSKADSNRAYIQYCIDNGLPAKGRTKFYELLQRNLPVIISDRRVVEGQGTPQVWVNLVINSGEMGQEEENGQQTLS